MMAKINMIQSAPRQKVIGEVWVSFEIVVKERKTKNTIRQNIKREIALHLKLDCGHTIRLSDLNQQQKNQKTFSCYECAGIPSRTTMFLQGKTFACYVDAELTDGKQELALQ